MSNSPVSVSMSVSSQESFNKKFWVSFAAGVLFVLVSLPQVYGQTDKLLSTYEGDCPTAEGKFLHAIIFFIIAYIFLKISNNNKYFAITQKTDSQLAKTAFYATLLFFVIASSDAYRLTGRVFSGLSNDVGCPNVKGVIVHGIIFLIVLLLTMYFPTCE
jgi:hypothetical protein